MNIAVHMKPFYKKIQRLCLKNAHTLLAAFITFQPFLALSEFWLNETSYSILVTATRALLFALLLTVGFIISDKKRFYVLLMSIIVLFFALRAVVIYPASDMYSDVVNYYRLVSIFIVLLPALTILMKTKKPLVHTLKHIWVVFTIILLSVITSYASGTNDYAYESMRLGVVGWFEGNSYGIIVFMLLAIAQLYFYKINKIRGFILASVAGYSLLYFAGTRVAFYSIIAIGLMWAVLMVINKFGGAKYYVLHVALVSLTVVLMPQSPMAQRQSTLKNDIESKATQQTGVADDSGTGEPTPQNHGGSNVNIYEKYAPKLVDKFGYYTTAKTFNYTDDIEIVIDYRAQKNAYSRMLLEQGNIGNLLVGHEVSKLTYEGRHFQPESDTVSIFIYYGLIGSMLYWLCLMTPIVFILAMTIIKRGWPKLFDPMIAVPVSVSCLAMTAGILGGSVLLVQNVSVHIAVMLAIYYAYAYNYLGGSNVSKK